jgi:membrane-associated phospholipid phosphatase
MALPAIAVAVGMVLLGLLVTHVLAGSVLSHEAAVNRNLAAHHTSGLNTATHIFTYLAETPTIVGLTAVAAAAFRIGYRRWHESVYLVLCVAGETLIFVLTSILINRHRPPVPHLDDAPPTSSFPSGHTAAAVCFYGAVALVLFWRGANAMLRALAATLAVLVPLLVGASRLYRGMHFPSDVVGGLVLAVVWLALTTWLLLYREPRYRPDERRRFRSPAAPREAVR